MKPLAANMKRNFLTNSIVFFFIVLFLYTGIMKFTEIHNVRQQLSLSPLMASLSGVISWALPIGEMLLAIALFIPKWRVLGLYASLMLMTLFTGYVTFILLSDDQLSCSCGGIIEELSLPQHVIFNSACVFLSLVGIFAIRRRQQTIRFRWLTSSSAVGLFVVTGWLLFTAFMKPPIEKTGLEGGPLPTMDLQLTDSVTHLNTVDIPGGRPFIVIEFSPWCAHCQGLTVDITQHIKEFKNARIYYITHEWFPNVRFFYRFYKLERYPNIIMGRDKANVLFSFFKLNTTPVVAIFDNKKRLRQVFVGQISAAQLAQSVNE